MKRIVAAALACFFFAGCSAPGSHSLPSPASAEAAHAANPATGGHAVLTLRLPSADAPAATVRRPRFIGAAAQSLAVSAPGMTPQIVPIGFDLAPNCSRGVCTIPLLLPAGSYTARFSMFASTDGSGAALSIANVPVTIAAGRDNALPTITLAGIASKIVVSMATGPKAWFDLAATRSSSGVPLPLAQFFNATVAVGAEPLNWFQAGHADQSSFFYTVLDAAGEVLSPSAGGMYTDASGNAVTPVVSSSDAHLAVTPPAPFDSKYGVAYDGSAITAAKITVSLGSVSGTLPVTIFGKNTPVRFDIAAPPAIASGTAKGYPVTVTGYDFYDQPVDASAPFDVPVNITATNTTQVTYAPGTVTGPATPANLSYDGSALPETLNRSVPAGDLDYGSYWHVDTQVALSAPLAFGPQPACSPRAGCSFTGAINNPPVNLGIPVQQTIRTITAKPSGVLSAYPITFSHALSGPPAYPASFALTGTGAGSKYIDVIIHEPYYWTSVRNRSPNFAQPLSGVIHNGLASGTTCGGSTANASATYVTGKAVFENVYGTGMDAATTANPHGGADGNTTLEYADDWDVTIGFNYNYIDPNGNLTITGSCTLTFTDDAGSPALVVPLTYHFGP